MTDLNEAIHQAAARLSATINRQIEDFLVANDADPAVHEILYYPQEWIEEPGRSRSRQLVVLVPQADMPTIVRDGLTAGQAMRTYPWTTVTAAVLTGRPRRMIGNPPPL